jgi:chemotaxis protein MotB
LGRRQQEEQQSPGIVVLYTSLMILLLSFFILLNALSQVEEARVKAVFQSLVGTFGVTPGGSSPMPSVLQLTKSASAPINPVEQDYLALRGLVQTEGLESQVRLLRSNTIKTAVLPDYLLFQPDSEKISPQGKAFLDKVAQVIKDRDYRISVRGHTDDAPSQRTDGKDNWAISADRALAVVRYLISQGVNPDRLAAFGLAGFDPTVKNDTYEHRRMNNRVELVFDARDASRWLVPEEGPKERKLDFKGFTFDLLGEGKGEKK